jgi:hypothetical protein
MKISIRHLIVATLLALSLVACTVARAEPNPQPAAIQAQDAQGPQRTLTVVGLGKVKLVPDIAEINVGAEARAPSVTAAKQDTDQQIAAIVDALKELGIADADIQTSHYSIHFEREPTPMVREGPTTEEKGAYRVSNMLRVTVRDVDQAGKVLDAVVEAGANQVYGVTFTVSDETEWQSKARAGAMADAKARAQELADLAEIELGQILTVSEVIGSNPMPMAVAERAYGGGGGGIAPGELEFITQIQVTFGIQ